MILVDTSVWIEHLRTGHAELERQLELGRVLGHPWVTGELALGRLDDRETIIALLEGLPTAAVATPIEVLSLIDDRRLHGTGIGYVDANLLASALITPEASALWTLDRPLAAVTSELGYEFVGTG
ncbi:MAG: type II toxin-antitoxin system VapC family toxin [Thermomicrobiales bacterium]|nr:type II toxin-antitoxin system VapC family toxin [Thermomicrobiales bacterium]